MILIMTRDEFWDLIESMGAEPDDDDFAALTDRLAIRDAAEIIAFADHLAEVLYALDTRPHARAAAARGDWFLYVRCAAVAAGRTVYAEVLANPPKLRRFARREAEPLLSVASDAYERSIGRPWAHESPVSYETGSNIDGWGGPAEAGKPPLWVRLLMLVARLLPRRRPASDED